MPRALGMIRTMQLDIPFRFTLRSRGPATPLRLWGAAAALLIALLLLLLGSVWEDAFTYDEPPYITAGYAYLRLRDGRLNPEHPPLLKLLAAVPLLPLAPRFPHAALAGMEDPHAQWDLAHRFLYESGNDPYDLARLARLVPILLTVGLGLALFGWARRWAGDGAALLALVFYVLSPTILAHGRYVTLDVPAALGVALAGFSFARFLAAPAHHTALLAGCALGGALLLKLSTALLVPYFAGLTALWAGLEPRRRRAYLGGAAVIAGSAALLVLLPYLWITARYPPERQVRDAYVLLFPYAGGPLGRVGQATADEDFARLRADRTRDLRACARQLAEGRLARLERCPAELAIYLADTPVMRGWGLCLLSLVFNVWRARGGDVTYFLGEVSNAGWWSYFPVVYALKEPLPFHLTTLLALGLALARVWTAPWRVHALTAWLQRHPAETLMLGWLALYWGGALRSSLNLGIRYLLPVFPFTLLLVAREVSRWLAPCPSLGMGRPAGRRARALLLARLLAWQGASDLRVYPFFLAYFNEAAGGPAGGARYAVDSNLDWGQDLRRLQRWTEARGIGTIALDYFGPGAPHYELVERYVPAVLGEKYLPWWSAKGPYAGWVAVSVTHLQMARARWGAAPWRAAEDTYDWLRGQAPVAMIGYSIWVFDLRPLAEQRRPNEGGSHGMAR